MNRTILLITSFLIGVVSAFAQAAFNAPGTGNPVIPGYFADPTIKKFGDTYYMYATTDGSGAGFGPAQVWTSKDFVNWTLMPMNWPDSHWIWAPDVMQHSDGSTTTFTASPVSSIAESVKLPVVRGRISWAIAKRSLSPTAS